MNLVSLPNTLFQCPRSSVAFILSSHYLNHLGLNKIPGKLTRFIDYDYALTKPRNFVFGLLGVTEARSSYDFGILYAFNRKFDERSGFLIPHIRKFLI